MNRRTLLKTGSLGALGVYLSGCARHLASSDPSLDVPPLTPVRASLDRVIRTTVGLRPYRASGFLVRAERRDGKALIHNYGHGGAGHSLSWGTGRLAAELALEQEHRRAAVIGCGIVGLTAARQLQRAGFEVTIYAASVPPDTTSNRAWASFTPTSGLIASASRTPAWDAQFRRAVRISHEQLQLLVGRGYGISWIDSYAFSSERPEPASRVNPNALLPADLRSAAVVLGPGEHPFPARYVTRRPQLRIEPTPYLDALVRDVLAFGARIVIRTFDTVGDLVWLPEPVVINCTGLGARELVGDSELTPVKGQLTFLVPQPEVDYITFGGIPGARVNGRSFGIHMMPRRDGIALGGTSERGVSDTTPDLEARDAIVQGHRALFDAMRRQA